MNITQEKIDDLNAKLKISVESADYQEKVEKVQKFIGTGLPATSFPRFLRTQTHAMQHSRVQREFCETGGYP